MQLVIHLDERGVIQVDLCSASQETGGREFFLALRPAIEQLGVAAKEVGRAIVVREEKRHEHA